MEELGVTHCFPLFWRWFQARHNVITLGWIACIFKHILLLTLLAGSGMVYAMLTKGPEFTRSRAAHHFDNLFRQPARAVRRMVEFTLPKLVSIAPDELIIEEPRRGVDGSITTIRKYRTKDAKGDYISTATRLLEKLTLDELAQLDDPSHAVFGHRRLNDEDHARIYGSAMDFEGGAELLVVHERIVGQADAGHFSSFGFRFHAYGDNNVMTRMEDNIRDVRQDSIPYRVNMLATGTLQVLAHELRSIKN